MNGYHHKNRGACRSAGPERGRAGRETHRSHGDRQGTERRGAEGRRSRRDRADRRGEGQAFEAGRKRGRRRMFEGEELRLVLLLLMEAEPRHGYDLIRAIEARTGGAYAPSPGIVYPNLTMLAELGRIEESAADGARKLYAITASGRAFLAEHRATAEAALARLDGLARRDRALDDGPVFRAMSNLKAALRQRLSADPDRALLFAVADAIDEAARTVERL